MTERKDRIRVHLEGKEYSVVGGSFQDMLAAVKQINGRRFVGELKVWQLPVTVEEAQRQLEINDYQLEGGTPVATDDLPAGQPSSAPPGGDRIRVVIGEHQLAVVGGTFQDMLATVKGLPGRRFDGQTKTWELPGEVGVIKGMIEAAGFQLEGAQNIPLDPVPPMTPPDFSGQDSPPPPPPFEPPDFFDDYDAPPFEPPDWMDDLVPPAIEESYFPPEEMPGGDQPPAPMEESATTASSPTPGGDRIRLRLGEMPLIVSGGSFQEMLTTIKNIPGRRFNAEEKVWEIPEEITLDSIQQTVSTAGFIITAE